MRITEIGIRACSPGLVQGTQADAVDGREQAIDDATVASI